jgi:hypothetical protein
VVNSIENILKHRLQNDRQIEGTYIVESGVPDGLTCDQDTRGPAEGRVCLYERKDHAYYVQTITNYNDNKIRHPPGMKYLLGEEGFKGATLEDFVRSSLFQDEIWRLESEGGANIQEVFDEAIDEVPIDVPTNVKRSIPVTNPVAFDDFDWHPKQSLQGNDSQIMRLDHYGDVPAAVKLPICRSWYGEAISDINSSDHSNAPCVCDPPARHLAKKWTHPSNWTRAYTKRFIKESKLYEMKEYGEMCHDHHDCEEEGGLWKDLLNLPADTELPKEMEKAWNKCRGPKGHGHHKPEPSPLSDAPATSQRPRPTKDSSEEDTTPTQATPTSMSGTKAQIQNGTGSTVGSESYTKVPDVSTTASSVVGGSTTILDGTGSVASFPSLRTTTYSSWVSVTQTYSSWIPVVHTLTPSSTTSTAGPTPTKLPLMTHYEPPMVVKTGSVDGWGYTRQVWQTVWVKSVVFVWSPAIDTSMYTDTYLVTTRG